MQHKYLINLNGKVGDPEDIKISVLDRGFLYGDSVYEVTRTHNNIPLFWDEHLDRLWQSAFKIGLVIDHSRENIKAEVIKTLQALGEKNAYIRIIITRGEGDIGLDPRLSDGNNFVIISRTHPENPKEWYSSGVSMMIPNIQRNPIESIDPNIKSGNYLNNVLAYREAKIAGAFDALMLNAQGELTEGTTNNIWMVKDNHIITPPLKSGLLAGITRSAILQIAKENNLQVTQKAIYPDELFKADEAFLTSSTREVVPVTKVDAFSIGKGIPGPITLNILSLYRKLVEAYLKRHESLWSGLK